MSFRECEDCTACCSGFLMGSAYGNKFGCGKACVFLARNLCTIYADRPSACRDYQCAWTQKLLPEWMRPKDCGVLVSVENKDDKQFLRVVEMRETVEYAIYSEIEQFCKQNNTYYVRVPYADC